MRNLFIKGLPMGFWEEDIGRLVAALGCVVTSSMVWRDKKGKSRGVALVEVETEEQAAELTQVLRLRTIFRRPQGAGDLVAQAGAGGQQVPAGVPLVVGEGESAWEVAAVPEGDRSALIVESAFRDSSHVRGPDEPRRPRKEDPQEKQKRCEVLRRARLAARRAELEAGVPEEERDSILTLDKVRRMRKKMSNDLLAAASSAGSAPLRCPRCWLLQPQCICVPATPPDVLQNFRHRTIVWLHPKEFGRLSNTGGLITVAFPPPQSRVLVAGLQEDEEALTAELERDPDATFVLFPSNDALTAQEFMDSLRHESSPSAERVAGVVQGAEASDERVYTIILVDGTWQQARRLALKIPQHVRRVKLMPRESIDPVYKSPMRSQATPDRVCSLSAYVLLLKELNTPPSVCDYLFQLLHKKAEIVLGASGKEWKQTDGHHITPKLKPPRIRRKKNLDGTAAGDDQPRATSSNE